MKKIVDSKLFYAIGLGAGIYLSILIGVFVVVEGILNTQRINTLSKNKFMVLGLMLLYLILMRIIISLIMKYIIKRAKLKSIDFIMVRDIMRALIFMPPVIVFLYENIHNSMGLGDEMKILILIYGIYVGGENNIKKYLKERKSQDRNKSFKEVHKLNDEISKSIEDINKELKEMKLEYKKELQKNISELKVEHKQEMEALKVDKDTTIETLRKEIELLKKLKIKKVNE